MGLNRFDDARALLDKAMAQQLDFSEAHVLELRLALLRGDEADAKRKMESEAGKLEEASLYEVLGEDLCRRGKIREARQAYTHSVDAAHAQHLDEFRGIILNSEAACEVSVGFTAQAQQDVNTALSGTANRGTQTGAVYVLARLGDDRRVKKIVDALDKDLPADTLLHGVDIPRARGAASLYHNDPQQTLRDVEPGTAYELSPFAVPVMVVHAEAYLRLRDGAHAVEEYRKILNHRGVNSTTVLYTLAYLGLARGYGVENDTAQEKKAYEEFFAAWKDADADIPVLQQAKAEYAKLQE
jgi:eukaryotic-like serine/threonine-protein kinase